jgi:hypothetical protein
MRSGAWLCVVGVLALGCGDDDGGGVRPDGGEADAGAIDAPVPFDAATRLIPPVAPALPEMACADGWRTVMGADGIATCDPWPVSGRAVCTEPDEVHFPGEPGCARIGSACTADPWASDLPAMGTILFVQAGAAAGGDGTRAMPYATIAEAIAAATSGTVIAVARGSYDESVFVPAGVTIWGACVAETRIAATKESGIGGTISIDDDGVVVRNVTLGGQRPGVTIVGGSLELRDVVIDGAQSAGIAVLGGRLIGSTGVVRGTRVGFLRGHGIQIENAASVTLDRWVLDANLESQVRVESDATVTLRDTAVIRMAPAVGLAFAAIDAVTRAQVTLERVAIEENPARGVLVNGPGTAVVMRDSVVRDTTLNPMREAGEGVAALNGAMATLERVGVERSVNAGILLMTSSTGSLTDVVVRETAVGDDGLRGVGLWCEACTIDGTRVWLTANHALGALLRGTAMDATLVDFGVTDTQPQTAGDFGFGIQIHGGAHVTITRALFARNRAVGVSIAQAATRAMLTDVRIEDTAGHGLEVKLGATVEVHGAAIEGSDVVGVLAGGADTAVTLENVRVAGTRGLGYGASSLEDAHLTFTGFELVSNVRLGMQVASGGTADLHMGVIADSPAAFNVQTAGFDAMRLRDGVTLTAVGVDLDTSALSVPVLMPPIDF